MSRWRSLTSEANRQKKLRRERRYDARITAGVIILFVITIIGLVIAVYRTMHDQHAAPDNHHASK